MDLTLNPKVDVADTTPLVLGAVEFRVAPLVLRQNARIGVMLPDVLAILNRQMAAFIEHPKAAAAAMAVQNGEPAPEITAEEADAFLRAVGLSESEAALLASVLHIGLTRVYPRLMLDDVLDLPIRSSDLINAASAIIEASRLTERKVPAAGEANAASR